MWFYNSSAGDRSEISLLARGIGEMAGEQQQPPVGISGWLLGKSVQLIGINHVP